MRDTSPVTAAAVDELLDRIAAELAPDVDDLVLEALRRSISRRARDLLGNIVTDVDDHAGARVGDDDGLLVADSSTRVCSRCKCRSADPDYQTCGDCRRRVAAYAASRRAARRTPTPGAAASVPDADVGDRGNGNAQPGPRHELELAAAAAGARGPRAQAIALGRSDPNALAV
jgi:hypothetical protein